jgi:hypothetical protein
MVKVMRAKEAEVRTEYGSMASWAAIVAIVLGKCEARLCNQVVAVTSTLEGTIGEGRSTIAARHLHLRCNTIEVPVCIR